MKKYFSKKDFFIITALVIVPFLWMPSPARATENPHEEFVEDQYSSQSPKALPEETSGITSAPSVEGNPEALRLSDENIDVILMDAENQTTLQKIRNFFSSDLKVLAYGIAQDPVESSRNPNNDFLEIPHYRADLEIRPDFYFNSNYLELSAKPRAKLDCRLWEEGMREGDTEGKDDWYVNEWLVRLNGWNRLFVSYGRENLQWGPSFLVSPSNPFFSDNGRGNTYAEIQGMDFVRLLLVPHSDWSISLIANTDEGRNTLPNLEPFDKTYALKIDYTAVNGYGSLIYSRKEANQTDKFGFFGVWTASDALLLYTEGNVRQGSNAWYPVKDSSRFGASLQQIHSDDNDIRPSILAGGAYTFFNGGTLTLEYLYNGLGYDQDEANLAFSTLQEASDDYDRTVHKKNSRWALKTKEDILDYLSSQPTDPGLRFLRRNYGMLQYHQINIFNRLAITLRWTQNFDDGSGQLFGLFSYSLGDYWDIFGTTAINVGNEDTEYGGVLNYQAMLGIKFNL